MMALKKIPSKRKILYRNAVSEQRFSFVVVHLFADWLVFISYYPCFLVEQLSLWLKALKFSQYL